jgi:hypothetical protein
MLALLAGLPAIGCLYHGPIPGYAAVSTRALSVPMTVVARDVEGLSCIGLPSKRELVYVEAVAAALRAAPGANALVNARFEPTPFGLFSGCTYRVRGTAVRVEPH